jgi:PAS domain S-box-containing protein
MTLSLSLRKVFSYDQCVGLVQLRDRWRLTGLDPRMNRIETNLPGDAGPAGTAPDEAARLAALRDLRVLDTEADPRFERVVRLAARLFAAPNVAIALIDEQRIWLKAAVGFAREDWPRLGGLSDVALRQGAPVFAGDIRADERLRHALGEGQGETRFYAAAPLVGADGQVIGLLCVSDTAPHAEPGEAERGALIDLAALVMDEIVRDAQAAKAREQSRFDHERMDLALSMSGLAAYEWDMQSDPIEISGALRTMIGWNRDLAFDRPSLRAMMHPDDRERAIAEVNRALTAQGRYALEFRLIRPDDGRVIWISSAGVRVAAAEGRAERVIGVIQDITARKIDEEERETLVAELDHRVKNVLAAVQSLAAQSARKASSLESFLKTFAGRLKSMASAHQLLTATRWRGAGMHNIAAAELGGLAPGQTRWSGPDVLLTPRGANAMSLALHELATNAVKFGSLSTEVGRVEVTWRRTEDCGLELQWLESHGPAVPTPTRRGFGTTLLEKVTGRELGGSVRVEYRAEGVRAVLKAGPSAFAQAPPVESSVKREATTTTLTGASVGAPSRQATLVRGLKLLIVEDALLLALELEAGLSEAGAEVLGSAADVGEALLMVDLPIDAAVLDANLNGASVLPVAQALAARGVPFVFATGYGDDKALPFGFDAPVIRKPYDVTQVAAALCEVTGRAEPARAAS